MALLTVSGFAYLLLSLWGALSFSLYWKQDLPPYSGLRVSVLKPLHGMDAEMYEALASHCRQKFAGSYEIVFGVTSARDPALAELRRLREAFPDVAMRVVECPETLGSNGKVSRLVQMLPFATGEILVVNDGDISVSPMYLDHIVSIFGSDRVGMVTAPYVGSTGSATTLWSKLESVGIATEFMPGVFAARAVEGGMRFGLGSTLAIRREALESIAGFPPLLDMLADDYELGARVYRAGWKVELCREVVSTTVGDYTFGAFWNHQMRWARSTRDSRGLGYLGVALTYALPWALLNVWAFGAAAWSLGALLAIVGLRAVLAVGVGYWLLGSRRVLDYLWLVPLRDCFGLLFWFCSLIGHTVVWRDRRYHLSKGRIRFLEAEDVR